MKVCWIFLFFFSLCTTVFSQDDVALVAAPQSATDSIRSLYIKSFPDHFSLWPVFKQRRLDFEMTSLLDTKKSITYKSNKPYSIGFGAYLFELVIELTAAVPLNEQSKRIYGESDARDLQLNIIGKRWGIDLYRQKYSGFYIDDPDVKVLPDEPYPQRADIETKNTGLSVNYTFNNKKFSFRSVYNFSDRQLRSAGSFVLFGSISGFQAAGDSAIINPNYAADFGDASQIQKTKVTTLSIAPGYTYSLIYKGFYLNGTLAIGPSHNWLYYESTTGSSKNDIKFNFSVAGRIGIGYNGDRFFGGLSFMNQGHNAKFDNIELNSSSGVFKVLFGFRFREFGILKKRPVDLVKQFTK